MAQTPFSGCPTAVLLLSADPGGGPALAAMLGALGAAVTIANNVEEAFEHATAVAYRAVIVDTHADAAELKELAHRLRGATGLATAAATPLIAVLHHHDAPRRDDLVLSGASAFLQSPVTFAALKSVYVDTLRADAPAASACVEPYALEHLKRFESGSPGLLQRVVDAFLRSSAENLAELQDAAQHADAARLHAAAHALKTSSANVGANNLANMARQLEARARAGATDGAATQVQRMATEHSLVCNALQPYLKQRSA